MLSWGIIGFMSAAYDTFDYPSYWIGRDYEHRSEVVALKAFLHKIPKINTILEIGAGFGRMIPFYSFRAKRVIVTEPSSKLLKIPRQKFKNKKNITFLQSTIDNIPVKVRNGSVDLIIMIRVLHHIEDVGQTINTVRKLLRNGGYFALEFANKTHFKAVLTELARGNINFINNEEVEDRRSAKSIKKKTLPFFNYHPNAINKILTDNGFEIIEKRSVSNIRSPLLKSIFSVDLLVYVESMVQKIFAPFNFGPSIFILAKKRA